MIAFISKVENCPLGAGSHCVPLQHISYAFETQKISKKSKPLKKKKKKVNLKSLI